MKFCENMHMAIQISDPEWAPFWVNYVMLKNFIKFKIPFQSSSSQLNFLNLAECPEIHAFFSLLNQEIRKASNFFDQTEEILLIREQRFRDGVQMMKQMQTKCYASRKSKLALSAVWFYKDLMALEAFATMTYCCMAKILKKVDKKTGLQVGCDFMKAVVWNANFVEHPRTRRMIHETHEIYECVIEKISSAEKVILQSDENLLIDALSRLHTKKFEAWKCSANVEAIFEKSTQNKNSETPSSALSLRSKVSSFGLNESKDTQNVQLVACDRIALSSFGLVVRLDFENMEEVGAEKILF